MNQTPPPNASRLMILFAAIYIAEGIGQMGGIIHQPLTLYLLDMHWNSTQIASFFSILSFPWLIKPLYGIVSDFVPMFGYRRKLYLVLANGLAVGGYLALTGMTSPQEIGLALVLTAFGMAVASTLCGAVLVENGKKSGLNGKFVSQQWLWFYIANIVAAFAGGWLCQHYGGAKAMQYAALAASVCLAGVMFASWFFTEEERRPVDIAALKLSLRALWAAITSKSLWVVGAFIFCYYFSPGFGTPMFVHMTKDLHFSQEFIGTLGSIGSLGHIIGALIYRFLVGRVEQKRLVYLSVALGAVSQLSFIWLDGSTSAIVLNFCNGVCGMIAVISVLTIAADCCADGAEGFTYAILMSIHNAATPASQWVGSYLYDSIFSQSLTPLIIVSALVTGASLLLLPLLKSTKSD